MSELGLPHYVVGRSTQWAFRLDPLCPRSRRQLSSYDWTFSHSAWPCQRRVQIRRIVAASSALVERNVTVAAIVLDLDQISPSSQREGKFSRCQFHDFDSTLRPLRERAVP